MEKASITDTLLTISNTFGRRGNENYGIEEVTQLQHALQSAALAEAEAASARQISAALLHDIGHILYAEALPVSVQENLDDAHEHRAYEWIRERFGAAVADPVRLHVAAKRYLCTVDDTYAGQLSPTSYKSYMDQGGKMSASELAAFEAEPYFKAAVQLRRWDDQAKAKDKTTPAFSHYEKYLKLALEQAP